MFICLGLYFSSKYNGGQKIATYTILLSVLNVVIILIPSEKIIHYFNKNLIIWNPKISWENFKQSPPSNSIWEAKIDCDLWFFENKVLNYPQGFVFVFMNPDSSYKQLKLNNEKKLLRHEQYHFNIAKMIAKNAEDSLKNIYPATSEDINKLFTYFEKKMHAVQKRYDAETDHAKNENGQKRWEKLVDFLLE